MKLCENICEFAFPYLQSWLQGHSGNDTQQDDCWTTL